MTSLMADMPDFADLSEEAWKIVTRLRDRRTISVGRPEGVAAVRELEARRLVVSRPDPDWAGVLLVSDHPSVAYAPIPAGVDVIGVDFAAGPDHAVTLVRREGGWARDDG